MHDKKVALFTGKTVSSEELFRSWDDILCRMKLAIDTNAEMLFQELNWKALGNHPVAFCGDYREEISSRN